MEADGEVGEFAAKPEGFGDFYMLQDLKLESLYHSQVFQGTIFRNPGLLQSPSA